MRFRLKITLLFICSCLFLVSSLNDVVAPVRTKHSFYPSKALISSVHPILTVLYWLEKKKAEDWAFVHHIMFGNRGKVIPPPPLPASLSPNKFLVFWDLLVELPLVYGTDLSSFIRTLLVFFGS